MNSKVHVLIDLRTKEFKTMLSNDNLWLHFDRWTKADCMASLAVMVKWGTSYVCYHSYAKSVDIVANIWL